MFTSSPSGEESVSPGVTTTDALEEGSVEEDNNDDAGEIKASYLIYFTENYSFIFLYFLAFQ